MNKTNEIWEIFCKKVRYDPLWDKVFIFFCCFVLSALIAIERSDYNIFRVLFMSIFIFIIVIIGVKKGRFKYNGPRK